MYLGVSSPIVDLFLSGEVPREVRLLAARGLVVCEGCDRLALLALVASDADAEVVALAARTVAAIPSTALSLFLERDDVPADLRAWFVARVPDAGEPNEGLAGVERRLLPRLDAPLPDADGQVRVAREFAAGERMTVDASESLRITAGNAGAFAYELNDRPGKPLGAPGQVARATIVPATVSQFQVP